MSKILLVLMSFSLVVVPAFAQGMDDVPIIPREVLFGNPEKASPQLSPDGKTIAYLAPLDGVLNVWVAPVDDIEAARSVTADTGRGIQAFGWAYTGEHLLYIQDQEGDENWHLYSVNLTTDELKDLTPFEGVQAQLNDISPELPNEVLVGLNDRVPQLHDLYRIDINTGERELVYENEGFLSFITDDQYQLHFGLAPTPDGGMEVMRRVDGNWQPFMTIGMEDVLTTSPISLNKDGNALYLIDSRDRNTAALKSLDLTTSEETILFEDERADVSDALIHPTEKTVQAAASNFDRVRWEVLDASIQSDLDYLRTVADGEINVLDRTPDDTRWIVAYTLDNGPVRYYLYDRVAGEATFLFTNRSDLEGQPLANMHPVIITARDGLELVSYLTLPAWTDADGDARPGEPLPMVLLVHGGPWARDVWGYNPHHQWLANRGYAVLSVNFRASTGFGKDFTNAGNLEWGAAMHDDLVDAVEWAVAEGIADEERVAIMGGSYGGYATLTGLTFTPEVFAAGVSIVGPSNLVTLLEAIPPYWQPMIELFATRVGDHRTEEGQEFLLSRSPLSYVDQIEDPLLIGQGANDPRVKQAESDQIVEAMQARDIPVTYVLYPNEGHGFVQPENNLSFYAVTEAFLAEHLGGRAEPFGDDLEGSTITVPAGAGHIPGLSDALNQQ
jgi:dipeptidyl aminopeptidase/acylaminoacyl peptidase